VIGDLRNWKRNIQLTKKENYPPTNPKESNPPKENQLQNKSKKSKKKQLKQKQFNPRPKTLNKRKRSQENKNDLIAN
jgi:hypothetical protein